MIEEESLAYECSVCGGLYVERLGRCSTCGSDGTLVAFVAEPAKFKDAVFASLREAVNRAEYQRFAEIWISFAVNVADETYFGSLLQKAKMGALTMIRERLLSGDLMQAVGYYFGCADLLASLDDFGGNERGLLEAALGQAEATGSASIRRAIFLEDDEQISVAYQAYQAYPHRNDSITAAEQTRVDMAGQRVKTLYGLRSALGSKNFSKVLQIYADNEDLLLSCRNFTAEERKWVDRVRQSDLVDGLRQAITRGDINQIADLGRRAIKSGYQLSTGEREAVNVARELVLRLRLLREAIDAGDDIGIALTADGGWLDSCPGISEVDRKWVRLAEQHIRRGAHEW